MTTEINSTNSQHSSAMVAAISLLIMTIAAIFSYGYVHTSLVVEDPAVTFKNIQTSLPLFRFELIGWGVIILTDLLVSWAFYMFLKPYHPGYSLLAGILRLVYTGILAAAVSRLVIAHNLVQGKISFDLTSDAQLVSEVTSSILAFESIWSIGLIVFGAHLLVIGAIGRRAIPIPNFISILLVIAGASYLLIHILHRFFPLWDHVTDGLEIVLSVPMMAGELGFGMWLLFKGRKIETPG
ncbi:DUF4386 domain-containing protein [Bacillus sp. 2205SS5-2]|uniref:DUF4386 domain-containing protein n=1 Tax=Bacillus sp. 2205SS5-2 TaxID=3109031 RepID=UPI0030055918